MNLPAAPATMAPVFDDLLAANRRFREGFRGSGARGVALRRLAVVTCIDSRIEPLAMLGLAPGDAKIIRNAGARVTDDVLRSLVLAVRLLGVDRVCLVHHTDCAVVGSEEAEIRTRIRAATGMSPDGWDFLAERDLQTVVRQDLSAIADCPLLPHGLVVGAFRFDVDTGTLEPID